MSFIRRLLPRFLNNKSHTQKIMVNMVIYSNEKHSFQKKKGKLNFSVCSPVESFYSEAAAGSRVGIKRSNRFQCSSDKAEDRWELRLSVM